MNPLRNKAFLGDFFQIQNKQMCTYGNVNQLPDFQKVSTKDDMFILNEYDWKIQDDVHQLFCEKIIDDRYENTSYTKEILEFTNSGSFLFFGVKPRAESISNWNEISESLILKLTQSDFSFRELYIVSAVAKMTNYTLAIADKPGAQLEFIANSDASEFYDLLSDPTCEITKRTKISHFDKHLENPIYFFKAKKLVLKLKKREELLKKIMEVSGPNYFKSWYDGDLLNHVKSNDLNVTTCLDFFEWAETSLDDVEKLY